MHPTVAFLIWLAAVLATQSLGYLGLGLLTVFALLIQPDALPAFLAFARRGRWLLLSLWLILAYGKPGEALADLAWAPTLEGVAEANLQAVRLLLTLLCLACLFMRLGRDGLLLALWGSLRPMALLGVDSERLVVRLSLVLTYLQQPLPAGAWRRMLLTAPSQESQVTTLFLPAVAWRWRDSLLVAAVSAALLWIVLQ